MCKHQTVIAGKQQQLHDIVKATSKILQGWETVAVNVLSVERRTLRRVTAGETPARGVPSMSAADISTRW